MDTPGDPKSGLCRIGQMASNGIPRYGMSPLMAPWATYGYSMGFHGARTLEYPIRTPKMGPKWVILGSKMVNFGVQNDQNEHGCFVLLRLFDPRGGPDRVPHSDPYFGPSGVHIPGWPRMRHTG